MWTSFPCEPSGVQQPQIGHSRRAIRNSHGSVRLHVPRSYDVGSHSDMLYRIGAGSAPWSLAGHRLEPVVGWIGLSAGAWIRVVVRALAQPPEAHNPWPLLEMSIQFARCNRGQMSGVWRDG